jgi:hypothetical protein
MPCKLCPFVVACIVFSKENDMETNAQELTNRIAELTTENEKLKELVFAVLISCNPPDGCSADVMKKYMKACFDKATEILKETKNE